MKWTESKQLAGYIFLTPYCTGATLDFIGWLCGTKCRYAS